MKLYSKLVYRKLIGLYLLCFLCILGYSQTGPKYSFSTSLFRYEKSDIYMYPEFIPKIMAGFEIQQMHKKYSFGIKYEYGYNDKEETCDLCADNFEGIAYMRENNLYLYAQRTLFTLADSMLKLNAGLSVYYANLYYFGQFGGGFAGQGLVLNENIHNSGIVPFINLQIFPVKKIFFSIQGSYRRGLIKFDIPRYYWNERVWMAPEFKIGVIF